jgi:hypothetical protein
MLGQARLARTDRVGLVVRPDGLEIEATAQINSRMKSGRRFTEIAAWSCGGATLIYVLSVGPALRFSLGRLSEVYATVGRARSYRAALEISSWPSMLRHFSLPRALLGPSTRGIIRGLLHVTFARIAESTSRHAQSAHQALSSSRLALSTTPSVFQGPQFVTWTSEMQKFHLLPPDVPAYPEIPRPAKAF